MEKYLELLKNSKLFTGMSHADLQEILKCLDAKKKTFNKNTYIVSAGEYISQLMLVLSGNVQIRHVDYWGNVNIINQFSVGEIFGESFIAPGSTPITNDVLATSDCTILFLNIYKLLTLCSKNCKFHTTLITNLFVIISQKNRNLVNKVKFISHRTTREKLLAYLSDEAQKANSPIFSIPFNRQELADFLAVERSAMSKELGKMKKEGIIDFSKNNFTLL